MDQQPELRYNCQINRRKCGAISLWTWAQQKGKSSSKRGEFLKIPKQNVKVKNNELKISVQQRAP